MSYIGMLIKIKDNKNRLIKPISNDTCSTCKFASIHCTEHDMDVASTDGCSDWEDEG